MSDISPGPSPEQLPTTSLPTTTTLIPPPTPSVEPQAAISKFSSLLTLSYDLTNYLLGRAPNFITDHPFNTLFAGAALALSARFIYRDHTRRSRKNVQLAVFHILKILQANPQYYDNVSDEDHWHLGHAQIEDEVNEAIAAHHLTTGEGAKVTRALKHKLWDKNFSIRRSMQGEFVAKRRKLKADQKEEDAAKVRYLKEIGKEEDEKKEVERPKKKSPKKPSFPPLKPRKYDDDDDDDGTPPPGGSGFVRPPGTPYAGGLSIFPDGQAQRPTRPQLPPAGQTPNGGPGIEVSYGPLSSITTSQLGLPPRESPTILDPRLPPDTELSPFTPGLSPSGSRFPTGNPRPANSLTFPGPSDRPPMPSFPVHFTVTPPIEASRINRIGPNGRDWWPCEFCKRMIWVRGWPEHIMKDSHIRRKKRAELKRQQQQTNASDSTSAGPPGKKEAGQISTNAAPQTVPPGKDPVRYCDICECPILLKRWDAHLNWPSHKRLKPTFGGSDDNHPDDDQDDNPDDGPHGNTDAFGQQIKPHKTNTPAPASTNRPTPAPPSSQQLNTNRRESQAALANPISANVTVAPNGQVTLTPAAPTPTQPVASAVIPPSLAQPALPPPPVTPAGALTSTSRPQLPLSTPATNRRYELRDRNNVIDRATKIAYHTAGLKTPTQFMDAVNAGLSPIPELEEGDEGFGTPPLPKLYNPTVKNKKPVHKVGKIVYGKTAKRPVRPDPLGFLNEVEPGSALDESQLQEQLLSEEGAATQPAVDQDEGGQQNDDDDLQRDDSRVQRPRPAGTNPFEGVELASNDGRDDDLYADDGAAPVGRPVTRASSRIRRNSSEVERTPRPPSVDPSRNNGPSPTSPRVVIPPRRRSTSAPVSGSAPPKKRGRPPGSRNKPAAKGATSSRASSASSRASATPAPPATPGRRRRSGSEAGPERSRSRSVSAAPTPGSRTSTRRTRYRGSYRE